MATKKNVLLNMISQVGGKMVTVLMSLIVVKIITGLGQEFYGDYLTTYEYLAFFGVLADGGLFAIGVREMSKNKAKEGFVLGNILSLRLLFIITATVLAGVTAQLVPTYSPLVKAGIWITGISMALTIVAGTLSSILQARMKIYYFSGSLALGKILLGVLIFLISRNMTLFNGNLLYAMLWAGVISNVIFCALVYGFARSQVPIRLHFHFQWWKQTLKESLPYGLALILQTLYLRIDILIISLLMGTSAVGMYGVPARVLESVLVLGVFFGQAILPKISAEEHDSDQVSHSLVWGMEKLLMLSLPLIIAITHFAEDIVLILSNQSYLSSAGSIGAEKLMILLIPTVFFAYFNQLFTYTLVAKNRQRYLLIVNGVALALNAGLNWYLLPRYGLIAAAGATVLCEVIAFTLLAREINQNFTLPWRKKQLMWIVLANLVLMAELTLTPLGGNLILAFVVGSLSYFTVIWLGLGNVLKRD